jgi:hypothetical protein
LGLPQWLVTLREAGVLRLAGPAAATAAFYEVRLQREGTTLGETGCIVA